MDRGWKPNVEISPNCPRCGSSNTKFCYYNNYSLTQPRYFCKGCRRYWTKGGSLRNVPVGGGCRKNRRGRSIRVISTDGGGGGSAGIVPSSKAEQNGPVVGQSYNNKDGSLLPESTTSSVPAGSHIDLALVYANFLNQSQPESKNGVEMPEFDTALELPNISDMHLDSASQHEENGFVGCLTPSHHQVVETQLCEGNQLGYFGELESIHHHPNKHHDHQEKIHHQEFDSNNNFGLPPFPGEEVGSHHHHHHHHHHHQECLWSNSSSPILMPLNHHHHALQSSSTQLLGLEPEAHHQEPNLVSGNGSWSPFDLSSYDNFSRP